MMTKRRLIIVACLLISLFAGIIIARADPAAETLIRAREQSLRYGTTETGVVFDVDGNEIGELSGSANAVTIPHELWGVMRNNIYTHNHPKGTAPYFSAKDIELASFLDVQQIRVVGWLNGQPFLCVADRGDSLWWATNFPMIDGVEWLNARIRERGHERTWRELFAAWRISYGCEVVK